MAAVQNASAAALLDDADPAVRAWAAQALSNPTPVRGGSSRGQLAAGGAVSPHGAGLTADSSQTQAWVGSRAGTPPAGESPASGRGAHTPAAGGASPFRGGTPGAASSSQAPGPPLGDVISVCVRLRGLNDQEQAATGQEVAWKCGGSYMWETSAEVRL